MAGRRDTGLAALAGVAAGAVTARGRRRSSRCSPGRASDPLVAVGSAFVDATPAWLKDFAASTFGTADKVVLGIGEVVVAARARGAGRGARRTALGVGRHARGRARGRRRAGGDGSARRGGARRGAGRRRRGRGAADPARAGPAAARRTRQRPRPDGVARRAFLQATAAAGALGVVGGRASAGPSARVRAARSRHGRRSGSPRPRRPRTRSRPASTSASTASARGRRPPTSSTGSTPPSWSRRSTRARGACGCTAWSRRRSRSPGTSCWRATSSRRG